MCEKNKRTLNVKKERKKRGPSLKEEKKMKQKKTNKQTK
jgi:hypothetical protein